MKDIATFIVVLAVFIIVGNIIGGLIMTLLGSTPKDLEGTQEGEKK